MRVQLDMFSGRPNPEWELPAAVERELAQLERGLRPRQPAREPPPLGYRGFVYREGRNARRAFDGILTIAGQSFEDPQRHIERLLVASMPDALNKLRAYLPVELRE